MNPLGALFGGGLSVGGGTSKSGDASGSVEGSYVNSYQYNAAFQVGGSGSTLAQTQTAEQKPSNDASSNSANMVVVYAALALAAFVTLVPMLRRAA